MGDSEVLLERSSSIARVILNRFERRNALGVRTLPALNGALDTDLAYEAYLQSFAFRSDDHKRRLAAFRAQRRAKPE